MLLTLDKLRFRARHGVLPQETAMGGDFEVSLSLHITDTAAARATGDDRLDGTVNYAEVYALVKREMEIPSHLIEHVAERIARAVLRDFPLVCAAEAEVRKCAPPIAGFCGAGAAVRVRRERRLAILDFDGTLADTATGVVRTMQAAFAEMGLPCPADEAVRQTIGLPLSDSIALLAGISGDALVRATDTYRRLWETNGTEQVALFEGVAETLAKLHAQGVVTAIATSRGHDSVESLCGKLGIRQYIDTVLGCDDVRRAKPSAVAALRLTDLHAVPPSQAWVVGDTAYDIAMGAAAGCHTCGVTYGNQSRRQLAEAGAERIADTFAEAAAHIGR